MPKKQTARKKQVGDATKDDQAIVPNVDDENDEPEVRNEQHS